MTQHNPLICTSHSCPPLLTATYRRYSVMTPIKAACPRSINGLSHSLMYNSESLKWPSRQEQTPNIVSISPAFLSDFCFFYGFVMVGVKWACWSTDQMAACFTQGSVSLEIDRLKAGITLCALIMKGVMYHISECFMARWMAHNGDTNIWLWKVCCVLSKRWWGI